ncbi:MAG: glycosyltransferase family 9 protein [Bdellovibrio sp.]
MKKSLILVRTDKIGDLILSLPVDELRPPDWDCCWIISEGMEWILQHSIPPRNYIPISKSKAWLSFWKLVKEFRKIKPTVSVHLQGPWWIALACLFAGISFRTGRKSQWFSFLFLNQGIRQSRRNSELHEAEYNQEILGRALGWAHKPLPALQLEVPRRLHLFEQLHLEKKKYVIVHPGMAGSALNWPEEFYIQLIEKLVLRTRVVITGSSMDKALTENIRINFAEHSQVLDLTGKLNPLDWMQVLAGAAGVVGPSTGVVHVAASLQTPVLGLYSPVRVQASRRWGPRGLNVTCLSPQIDCPGIEACLGVNCDHYSCMKLIQPKAVYEKIRQWL